MGQLKLSTTRSIAFLMVDSSDHITGKTGLTVTVTLSKDAAAFGAAGGTVTEISSGWYKIALTTTDTNTLGDLAFHCTAAAADPSDFKEQVVTLLPGDGVTVTTNNDKTGYALSQAFPANFSSLSIDGTGVVKSNLSQILGTALTETAGQLAAAFRQFFNIASPTSTMNAITSVGSVTGSVASVTGAVGSVTGAVGSVTGNVGGNVTGSVGSVAAGGITAATIATDAIDADAIAASAVTEIAAGVAAGSAPTAADNAAAVWNAAATSFNTAGSMGQKLNAAGGAADPLTNTVPGSYAANTAGYALGTLPTSVGSVRYVYTVHSGSDGGPLLGAGVTVWITSDSAGANVIAGPLITNDLSQVTFFLDPGTYYFWLQKSGWTFSNPDTQVVS